MEGCNAAMLVLCPPGVSGAILKVWDRKFGCSVILALDCLFAMEAEEAKQMMALSCWGATLNFPRQF